MAYSQDNKGVHGYFSKYWFGVAAPITVAEHKAVDYSIRWGAKQIELGNFPTKVGDTGRQVLKELAKVNKLEYTYHFPFAPEYYTDLSIPEPEQQRRVRETLEESYKYMKDVGAKVMVVHPTTLPRDEVDRFLAWDEAERTFVPIKIRKEVFDEVMADFRNKGMDIPQVKSVVDLPVDIRNKVIEEARKRSFEEQEKLIKSEILTSISFHRHWYEYYQEQAKAYQDLAEKARMLRTQSGKLNDEIIKDIARQVGIPIYVTKEDIEKDISLQEKLKRVEEEARRKAEEVRFKFVEPEKLRVEAYEKRYKRFLPPEVGGKGENVLNDAKQKMVESVVQNLLPYAERACRDGIKIAIENLPSQMAFSTPEEIAAVVNRLHSELRKRGISNPEEYIGATFDMGHANTMRGILGYGPDRFLEELRKRGVPIKEVHAAYERLLGEHLPVGEEPGKGIEMWEKIKAALEKAGFKGPITMESGEMGGIGYYISLQKAFPSYFSQYGIPFVGDITGRANIYATVYDPIHIDKREHYFTESFIGSPL
ncbi:MAG: sugar phosphate isomerase/epimerase [Candidatus Parvarchaeota archaeon]|nr:sugar phosphate isomerase/epimerase [Candidatus Jingweiarchaeum tengchongense]MCW1298285.1 sugar phosphate isomerase/epimerase [Candidatus Jingweiarchaeum tengchongense]MCW1300376.1 sugar phosphate isomerase/epimerase [Candidatus Jingweiarchaeum tengchongense]MCW1304779.1 sugar phosphate isomerase/epimerase [Candidatus Jingweiarchaeum tengchongense]MCW1305369.1 sugar phosphate isomerase/epimerase [Candidatus Jingweiarchaeum tengchongense]